MKKCLFLLLLVMGGLQASAQQGSVIDRFFEKYESDRSFTLVSITPKMFSMFSKVDIGSTEGKQMMQVVQKLKGLRILAKENTKDGVRMFKEASSFLGKDMEDLMTVRDGDSDIRFLVKENAKGNIAELVMLVGGKDEFVAMSLVGDIDLNQISKIAGNLNIGGLDKLNKLEKKKP